jgi:hypothetical protein
MLAEKDVANPYRHFGRVRLTAGPKSGLQDTVKSQTDDDIAHDSDQYGHA